MRERLQKLIAQAGIASRRDSELLIQQGRVTVNGKRAILGDRADLSVDDVRVDGERLKISTDRVYIILNKPLQVVTAVTPQHQETRQTVRDLIPIEGHLYPAGRLDADSEGLVLMTNDGDLAERLTHPRYQKAKVYEVTVLGRIPEEALEIWARGVMLDDGMTLPVEIKVLSRDPRTTTLQITMTEGRKRQIRRIASTLGYPVQRLIRTHFASLALGNLRPGEWRYLTEAEIAALQALANSLNMTPRPRFVRRTPTSDAVRRDGRPLRRPIRSGAGTPRDRRDERGERPERRDERAPRDRRDERGERPSRPTGRRPFVPRSGERPERRDERTPRDRRDERGERPSRPIGRRPFVPRSGERPERRDERTPRDERGERPSRPIGRRPFKPTGGKPRTDYPRGGKPSGTKRPPRRRP
ncbi:MAG: rRNA pseudouridine synthase [Chloroflexi bacterium CFX4]|nr:rRNA pseudouridine synthase [Chloroflexi bacterium CFX4]